MYGVGEEDDEDDEEDEEDVNEELPDALRERVVGERSDVGRDDDKEERTGDD